MLILLLLGVPVYGRLGAARCLGSLAMGGLDKSLAIVGLVSYSRFAVYAFSVVPLFILMGSVFSASRVGADTYAATRRWMGSLPGGLAQATIVANTLFGAACGSGLPAGAPFGRPAA